MSKFQLCTSSGFGIISGSITFQAKNRRFFCSFVSQFTITWPRIPKLGTHDSFDNSYVESKFQLFRFYRLRLPCKSIIVCQNSRTKPMIKSKIKSQLTLARSLNYSILNFYWKQNKISRNKIAPLKLIAIDQFKSHTTATQAKYWCTISAILLTKLISRTLEY